MRPRLVLGPLPGPPSRGKADQIRDSGGYTNTCEEQTCTLYFTSMTCWCIDNVDVGHPRPSFIQLSKCQSPCPRLVVPHPTAAETMVKTPQTNLGPRADETVRNDLGHLACFDHIGS